MGARLAAVSLYVVVLLGYGYWRSRADFPFPSAAVEITVIVVPSLLLGFVVRSWWVLLVPLALVAVYWMTFEGVGRLDRLDLLAYIMFLTFPPAWLAAAIGVLASRAAERYL